MGLFDWIGEAIGNAFSALAEFISDGLGAVFRFAGKQFKEIGRDSLGGIVSDIADGDSTALDDIDVVVDSVIAASPGSWDAALNRLDRRPGEMTPEDSTREAKDLRQAAVDELISKTVVSLLVEALSLGQVEGAYALVNLIDRTQAMSTLAGEVEMMRMKTQVLTSYQRRLNSEYPNVIPGATDLVRMQLREVFHPDYRPELLEPSPSATFNNAMLEHGFNKYWSDSYWAAHWVLPSMGDLDEMLHRRRINIDEWRTMVRRNDYLPAWIDRREKIIYKPYTRVDVRRMWDLAQLSEQEVLDNYRDLGYDELHATKMTIWTKIYVLAVELRARYSKGWISAADVKSEIIAAGMPPTRAEIWVQKIVKSDQEDRMISERDLTKAEIVKGVKEGFLTASEGVELLVDMGYDEAEAEYIIAINVEAIGGSPETLEEFQDIVNKRRIALGLPIRKKEPKTKQTGTGSDKTTEAPTGKKKQK